MEPATQVLPHSWFTSPLLILALSVACGVAAVGWYRSCESWRELRTRYIEAARRLRAARQAWCEAMSQSKEWRALALSRADKARVPTAEEILARARKDAN